MPAGEPRAAAGFPADFLWGAATSAYQIEGSPLADGAAPSNWHRFLHTPGRSVTGDTGDVACDHYRRSDDDVELMGRLGLRAYRFSLAWSRILPAGRGRVNPAGIDFYSRLVDSLLERGILPCATLYHWDHPAELDYAGGWAGPEMPERFAEYARAVFRALGDRVPMWATLNEPWVVTHAGYVAGVHPPGRQNPREALMASRNLLRGHGLAVKAYRAEAKQRIGLVVNLEPKVPASDDAADVAAAARADAYMNRQYLDPVFHGRYPEELAAILGEAWTDEANEGLADAGEPIDFLGINYYTRGIARHDDTVVPDRAAPVRNEGALYTETGWEVHPQTLTDVLRRVKRDWGDIPLYVTENGAAFPDPPRAAGGTVADPLRVDYLRAHLRAARAAIEHGVDLRGYFVWSLMDNCEWAQGYSKRFGIVHVDFETQVRTLKASARFYRDVIGSGGGALG